jgi:hypothetical protein
MVITLQLKEKTDWLDLKTRHNCLLSGRNTPHWKIYTWTKSEKKEIIKIRAEMNEVETKWSVKRIIWLFEKDNFSKFVLLCQTKRHTDREEREKITKIRGEKGSETTYYTEIQKLITEYFENDKIL